MIKNYFLKLGSIFKDFTIFFVKNFKEYNLPILLLALVQIIIGFPIIYFSKEVSFSNFTMLYKILFIIGLISYFSLFFYMFKKVFNFCAFGLNKEKISNKKAILGLLTIGLFNIVPILVFVIFYLFAVLIPNATLAIKIFLDIFTYVFYLVLCLSIASIVNWQNRNVFIAIFKSIEVFFKKILYTAPVFILLYLLAMGIIFTLCALIYAIAIKTGHMNETLEASVHLLINLYIPYIFAGLYIGAQVKLLEGDNE